MGTRKILKDTDFLCSCSSTNSKKKLSSSENIKVYLPNVIFHMLKTSTCEFNTIQVFSLLILRGTKLRAIYLNNKNKFSEEESCNKKFGLIFWIICNVLSWTSQIKSIFQRLKTKIWEIQICVFFVKSPS